MTAVELPSRTRLQDRVNEQRQVLAAVGTLALGLGVMAIGPVDFMRRPPLAEKPPLPLTTVTLEQPPKPVEPPPPPPPPAVQQLPAKPLPPAPAARTPSPPAATDTPAAVQAATAPAAVPSAAPSVAAVPAVAPPGVPPPPAPAVAAAEPVRAPASPPIPPPNPEAGFVAQLRAQVNAAKRYPTGREASLQRPSGQVTVWFVLSRNGNLVDAGVQDSSNSIILDSAAVSTVRRASFPTWPEAAWPGESSHRFTVRLDFVPPN